MTEAVLQVLKNKMNVKPRKDESDERDEPFASEDEVEHEVSVLSVKLIPYGYILY